MAYFAMLMEDTAIHNTASFVQLIRNVLAVFLSNTVMKESVLIRLFITKVIRLLGAHNSAPQQTNVTQDAVIMAPALVPARQAQVASHRTVGFRSTTTT
jgi:hypothetical protein